MCIGEQRGAGAQVGSPARRCCSDPGRRSANDGKWLDLKDFED